tara:strand:+ start:1811 stop:1999 length:189 start_codon:yes stop_codon:yes gene_type:complete
MDVLGSAEGRFHTNIAVVISSNRHNAVLFTVPIIVIVPVRTSVCLLIKVFDRRTGFPDLKDR